MDDTTVETVQNDIVESAPVETRSARLQNLSTQPDYSIPELYTTDMAFKESTMQLTAPEIENLVRSSGLKGSRWEQTGVAVENALTGMNNLRDEMRITVGNLANAISGGSVGQELQDLGYRNIDNTMSSMQLNEDSVGGVTDLVAKLVGGATSFTQLAAESIISAGVLPLAHIGIQTYGEGAYNDMKKYEEEHGSLEGYKPETVDVAINLLNSAFQVGSEAWLGVGSPRFLRGWSRGAWKEGLSGFVQESIQGAVNDFAEIAKGNKEFSDMLDSADDYLVDGVIGAVLQGGLGAATYSTARRKSDNIIARAHAIAKGRKTPNREDFDIAKKLNDAKEREYASVLTTEFKAQFDASTGEGKLQQNIANALNKAVQAKELDLGTDSETDLAQKLEAIATQETMNAMEMAAEQGKSVSEMELNNIVYKDGAIYLEGETPELGERAVDRARVIAERQSGLAEAKTKLDALNQEIKETQKALDEAKAAAKEAQVKRLQARLEKQKALEAKRTQEAERLQVQTEKLQKRIEARLAEQEQAQAQEAPIQEVAPTMEMPAVETATETQATVADTQALEELTRAVRDNEIALTKLERAQWEKMNETQTAQQTPQAQQVAQAERVQFAKQMLDKYKPDWQKSAKPMAQVAQKAQPKPMAKVLEKAAKFKGEKKSLKAEREAQKKAKAKKTTAPTVEDAELLHQGEELQNPNVAPQIKEQFDLADENARLDDIYPEYTGETIRIIDPAELKQAQYEVIQRTNPMQDEYHVGIRSVNDIKTFDETIDDKDSFVWGDYSQEDAKRDLAKNEITIYSSKPIENGVFVSTSYKQAQEYAGGKGAKVYEKTVPLDYVAWISGDEGQFAITDVIGKKRTVYNSNGDRIAKSKEALTNFWRWFGDSKVVDEQGRPLVVYHSSNVEFDTFDKNKGGFTTEAESALYGFYFTSSAGIAESYANIARPEKIKQLEKEYQRLEKIAQKTGKASDWDAYQKVYAQYEELELNYEPTEKIYNVYLKIENPMEYDFAGKHWEENKYLEVLLEATNKGNDGVIFRNSIDDPVGTRISDIFVAFEPNQIKSVDNRGTYSADTGNILKQSKVEGTGSDKYRGGYDERLKRIILGEKSDLTTIQHEFAHYWMQNNFKWARSGLASQDWLRRWRDVEEALGIEPQDRYLSRQASEKFARAYERYIMEGKVADDLKWAFNGFQKFYKDTYEDLENEYFDLSEELDPKIVDWFNRQRPVTEEQLKQDTYKRVAEVAMSQGAEIITETGDGNYVVSSMNKDGEVVSDVVVDSQQAQQSKLAKFRDTQKSRGVVEGLRESNPNIKSDQYNVLNRAETVDQARQWINNDRAGAWQALNSDSTNIIDRTALFQAFKELAENGDYALGAELASIKFPKQMTEVGQALSVLGERAEFDPLTILETKQKSLGVPTAEDVATQINEMGLDTELTAEQVQELENTTECVL